MIVGLAKRVWNLEGWKSEWEDDDPGRLELPGMDESCRPQEVRKEHHKQDGSMVRDQTGCAQKECLLFGGMPQSCFQGLSAGLVKPTLVIQDNVHFKIELIRGFDYICKIPSQHHLGYV